MTKAEQMKAELKNCSTLNEIFAVTGKYYNLDMKLGALGKAAVINNIMSVIKITGTKER